MVDRTGNAFAPQGDAVSMADTAMSGTFVPMTPPVSGTPMLMTRNVRDDAPNRQPTSAMMGMNGTQVAPPAASEAALRHATLERVTMLENQVSSMNNVIQDLRDRVNEQSSSANNSSTPRRQAAAGASPTTSDITFEDLQAQRLSDAEPPAVNGAIPVSLATREWVEGPKTPVTVKHTIKHAEGFGPVNCTCSSLCSYEA